MHVAALATLNRMAPGRVFLGMATGTDDKWIFSRAFADRVMARY